MIKAIIFDFGNVICSFDNDLFLKRISRHTSKSFEEVKKLIYVESNLPNLYETGLISSKEFFEKIVKLCDLKMSRNAFVKAFINIFHPIKPTFQLIKNLKKKYVLALLSNTSELHFNLGIKPLEIFNFFDAVSLSFETKAMKPDSRIYKDCLKKLGLKPGECVYIDDIKNYSSAASKLGMFGVHYTSPKKLEKSLGSLGVDF
ncbi:MAG: HAD family phosphatase [Nanoarchaeota archaeon]|nr:HAD family phosphatase [Nanoarchaeota archaeon]